MKHDTVSLAKATDSSETHYAHLLLFDTPHASTGISLFRSTDKERGLIDKSALRDAPIRLFVFGQDGLQHANLRVGSSSGGLSLIPLTSIAPSLPAQFGIRLAQVIAISSSPFTMYGHVGSPDSRGTGCSRIGTLTSVRPAIAQCLLLRRRASREQALLIANRGEQAGSFRITLETSIRSYVYEGWIPGLGSAFWSPEMTLPAHEWHNADDMLLRIEISEEADTFGFISIESEWLPSGEYHIKQVTPHLYRDAHTEYEIRTERAHV